MKWRNTARIATALVAIVARGLAQLPPLVIARETHFALLRDDGKVYVFGGTETSDDRKVELYDPLRGSSILTVRPELEPVGVSAYPAIIQRNRLFLCKSVFCQVYDPAAVSWKQVEVDGARTPLITMEDGRLLRAGGQAGVGSSSLSFLIDSETLVAERVGVMNEDRALAALMRLRDGRVLAAGGLHIFLGGFQQINSSEIFDPATKKWAATGNMNRILGPLQTWTALSDGRGMVLTPGQAEVYDPTTGQWQTINGLSAPGGSAVNLLKSGQVLISGGTTSSGGSLSRTTIFDPQANRILAGRPMSVSRFSHATVALADGTLLALGGNTGNGTLTNSVEMLVPGEPQFRTTLDGGFYVATAEQSRPDGDGLWGIAVHSSGPVDGGLNFGGLLSAGGKEVGFGAFYIANPQTVTGTVNLQALPGATGPLEFTLNVLDVNKNRVAGPIQGLGNLTWSQALQPGFYVLELRSSDRAPAASFQMAVTAPQLQAGGSAGASLQASAGVTGFVGFYLASKQDVTINLYNEQTYGYPRGAGEVILTLYDSAGKVLQRIGPGATPP